uniref:Mediator of RNA polymerase II transcription subunit 8 n=1 Tax=Trichuris muris TaxID=70415 RepID=A0A5S6QB36_TRIMR
MEEREKVFIATVTNIVSQIESIQQSLQCTLSMFSSPEETDWPTLLATFAIISGQFNSVLQILRNERTPILKSHVLLPARLSMETDADIQSLTENRVSSWNHAVVPNYLRTKPEPQIEQKDQQVHVHIQQRMSNPDSVQKQINSFNRCVNSVLDILSAIMKDQSTELDEGKVPSRCHKAEDTRKLVAATSIGRYLRPAYTGNQSSRSSGSGSGKTVSGKQPVKES